MPRPGESYEKSSRLVTLCASGDGDSWDLFLKEYGALIYSIAGKYCQVPQRQREIFIHVIEKLWEGRARRLTAWEGRSRFSTFLAAIVSRLCADCVKGRLYSESDRYMSLDDRAAVRAAVDEGAGARTRALRRECGEVLEAAVGLLPHNERAIMELFYWQGMGYGEIAVLLRTTVGQVGKKLFRARRKLREMLLEKGIKNSADVWE